MRGNWKWWDSKEKEQRFRTPGFFYFLNPIPGYMTIYWFYREWKEERERNIDVMEKHRSATSHTGPDLGWNLQARYMPWLRNEPTILSCVGRCSNQLSTGPGKDSWDFNPPPPIAFLCELESAIPCFCFPGYSKRVIASPGNVAVRMNECLKCALRASSKTHCATCENDY